MEKRDRTLNEILESIDEMDHLATLLQYRSRDMKGATVDEILNKVIHPTLDDLELYLRYYLKPDCSEEELKQIVSGWIDAQMSI